MRPLAVSRSRRGATAPPPGATSCGARSRRGRRTSRASWPRASRSSASSPLDVGDRASRRRSPTGTTRVRERRRSRSTSTARSRASAPGTSSSRAPSAASTASRRCCPQLAELGFDVVYLPPIHPIGRSGRKGRNNTLPAEPGDPGSPWAIGAEEGGHDAIHPELGTLADFDRLVATRKRARPRDRARLRDPVLARPPVAEGAPGVVPAPARRDDQVRREPAQALPGHRQRRTGTPRTGRASGRRCATSSSTGSSHGVRIFRVDNPHTKPLPFWEWLIAETCGVDHRT